LPTVQNDQSHVRWSCFNGTGLAQFTTIVSVAYLLHGAEFLLEKLTSF